MARLNDTVGLYSILELAGPDAGRHRRQARMPEGKGRTANL